MYPEYSKKLPSTYYDRSKGREFHLRGATLIRCLFAQAALRVYTRRRTLTGSIRLRLLPSGFDATTPERWNKSIRHRFAPTIGSLQASLNVRFLHRLTHEILLNVPCKC